MGFRQLGYIPKGTETLTFYWNGTKGVYRSDSFATPTTKNVLFSDLHEIKDYTPAGLTTPAELELEKIFKEAREVGCTVFRQKMKDGENVCHTPGWFLAVENDQL